MAFVFHEVLNYIYIVLIVVQFILAMGNRPQGSKWAYIISITFFAFLMAYMVSDIFYNSLSAYAMFSLKLGRIFAIIKLTEYNIIFKINDNIYSESMIVGPSVLAKWSPQTFSELNLSSLEPILQQQPNLVLLGTGQDLIFPKSGVEVVEI